MLVYENASIIPVFLKKDTIIEKNCNNIFPYGKKAVFLELK